MSKNKASNENSNTPLPADGITCSSPHLHRLVCSCTQVLHVRSGNQANTGQSFSRPLTDGRWTSRIQWRRRWCVERPVHVSERALWRKHVAGHEAAGEQQLCSWWQIKTQRILLSTGMHLTCEPERLVTLRRRCVYSERIRRLQVGVTGVEIQSCHHAANLRYIVKQSMTIHYQLRRKNAS